MNSRRSAWIIVSIPQIEVLFPVSASYNAIQSLGEKEVGFLGESFYLAAVYSFYLELNADDQFPWPGTLKKSPLFEFHCEVSARSSCHGNSPSPMGGSTGIWPKCRLDLRAFFFLDFSYNHGDSGIR